MEMTWEDYLATTQSLESKKPENEYRSSIGEIRARYDQLVKKHEQQPKLKNAMIDHPQTTAPSVEDGSREELGGKGLKFTYREYGTEPWLRDYYGELTDEEKKKGIDDPKIKDDPEIKNEMQLPIKKVEHGKELIAPISEASGVSVADIYTAKVAAQGILDNEALMKGDMVNEGHEKTAVNAAIQSKQFLHDSPQHETYSTELTRIRKESGKDVKIIEGKVNKYYGPGQLKLYEKTAVLSLSRNLKVAYDINDLKGQMPEAQEKAIPVRGIKLLTDENGGRKTHITPANEKTVEHER